MASSTRSLLLLLLLLLLFCFSSTSSSASAPKVRLSLYYETLCPYCSRFIVRHLSNIFTDGLISIVDLDLVPYGNAKVRSTGNITCQHGPYECLLNTVEACAIDAWPDVTEHFNFIYCIEELAVENKYEEWESCFAKLGLNSDVVSDCYTGGYGKQLELQYAAQTEALEPPHTYVPWVLVNGRPLYDDYQTFETEVCKAYQGDLPKTCEGLLLEMTSTMKANKAGQVSYSDEMIMSSVLRSST